MKQNVNVDARYAQRFQALGGYGVCRSWSLRRVSRGIAEELVGHLAL